MTQKKLTSLIKRCLERTEYTCLGTGRSISLKNRIIDHKELHPETKRHNTLFYASSSLDWQELIHKERGMQSMFYGKLPGLLEHGFVTLKKGGLLPLHWHKETEYYVIFRGVGIFQIGDETVEVNGNKEPTLSVVVPGNVPHQFTNHHEEPVMFYYYFPEHESLKKDIAYYFPCGEVIPPGDNWLSSDTTEDHTEITSGAASGSGEPNIVY